MSLGHEIILAANAAHDTAVFQRICETAAPSSVAIMAVLMKRAWGR